MTRRSPAARRSPSAPPAPPAPRPPLPPLPWKTRAASRYPNHSTLPLVALLRDVVNGFYVPADFQRPFVWADAQVVRLLDSLRRGFHVGTLIAWRQRCPARTVDFGGVAVQSRADRPVRVLLDGQQRVGALVRAVCSGRYSVHLLTGEFLVDAEPAPWVAPLGSVVVPWHAFREDCPGHESLFDWSPVHADRWGLDRSVVNDVACEMSGAFESVYLSLVELDEDYSRADLIEMFVRLAREGTPLSPADLDRALALLSSPEAP